MRTPVASLLIVLVSAQAMADDTLAGAAYAHADALVETDSRFSSQLFRPARGEIALVPSVSLAALSGSAQDAPPDETTPIPDESDWRFVFDAYWWLPFKISGPVDIGPTRTNVDIDLATLLSDLKFMIEGGLEFTNDQWSVLVWGLYLNIGTDAETTGLFIGTVDVGLNFKATFVNVVGAYRVGDWSLGKSRTATWGLDVLAGMMYWDLDLEVDARGSLDLDDQLIADEEWVDLIVGGRLVFDITDQLTASVRGEVGGFGIGSSADLTWSITAMAEYMLTPRIGIGPGYRYLEVDWQKGSGLDRVAYDWTIHGPIIGASIQF